MNPWDHHYFLITVLNNTSIPVYSFVYKPTTIAARDFLVRRGQNSRPANRQYTGPTQEVGWYKTNQIPEATFFCVCSKTQGHFFHRQRKMEPEEETQVSIKEAILIMFITFRVDLRKLERIDPRRKM